jgi:glyoxylase-like metal-dependent hydrolase (beta-lactamase superfamily II)
MRMKRWLWALAIIGVVLLSAKVALLDTAASPGAPYSIDIDALHRAAIGLGPLPERIEVERLGTFGFPKKIVVAGDAFEKHPMVVLSHRVVWPNRTLIVDAGASREQAKKMPGAKLDEAAFERMQSAIKKADVIVFTHEHSDHVGGLANSSELATVTPHVWLTREQLSGPQFERKEFTPATLEHLRPLAYRGLYSVAPGVVVQKAPGHTVGSQLVYVELANGQRYLFVGDIAWAFENITRERGRPRLVELLMKEDRAAVASQLHAIRKLPSDIHVIVAHDDAALERDLASGALTKGFTNL